ncbi:hypothetical protein CGLO_17949 [Colletotrichum gloeosporioides Cg-14]|uniref:Uncharacterized protein n=1 Tax=Colletotrichum gloeosporioides (strain Cg-14) TaxID=1237896 RepID=T0JJ03_COLGC|nr:hypothetical protein CGLO_17949 [Colletotrichum gloeosporioides Cg-14]
MNIDNPHDKLSPQLKKRSFLKNLSTLPNSITGSLF